MAARKMQEKPKQEEYGACDQCETILFPQIHIYIMSNKFTNEEETICEYCHASLDYNEEGWYCDEDDSIN